MVNSWAITKLPLILYLYNYTHFGQKDPPKSATDLHVYHKTGQVLFKLIFSINLKIQCT